MPTKSAAQARLMQAVAHNKAFAKKVDIPQNVGQEFVAADAAKGKHMATKPTRKMPSFLGKTPAGKGKSLFAGKESKAEEAMEKKQFPGKKAYAKAETKFEQERPGMKGGGKVKKYADGGVTEGENENIGDETRARAMRFARGEMESEAPAATPRRAAPAPTPRPAPRPAPRPTAPAAEVPAAPATPSFSRIPGPAAGSAADKALKTYEPPTEDPYAGLKGVGKTAAMMAAPAGLGALARGAGTVASRGAAAVKAAGAPATKATAEIGKRVARTADELMEARGADTAKRVTEAAERTAPKMNVFGKARSRSLDNPADKVRAASKAPERQKPARKTGRKADVTEARGEYLAQGGMVRGGGAAKRGVGRGKMC